jgi:hypothetical protein
MRSRSIRLYLILLLILAVFSGLTCVEGLSEEEIRIDLANAFELVAGAEAAGADVSDLVLKLDEAARIASGGSDADLQQAEQLIGYVESNILEAQLGGEERIRTRYIVTIIVLISVASIAAAVWLRGSGWFWRLWLRVYGRWRVEKL